MVMYLLIPFRYLFYFDLILSTVRPVPLSFVFCYSVRLDLDWNTDVVVNLDQVLGRGAMGSVYRGEYQVRACVGEQEERRLDREEEEERWLE